MSTIPVELRPDELTRHAAFLGGSGSGKATVALNLVEQLLERGVLCVLVDRKVDLCGYADPAWWNPAAHGEDDLARKRELRPRLDVSLYTPGDAAGRPIRLTVVPAGMNATKEFDQLAASAAAALGSMVGLKAETRHAPLRAILLYAIRQFAVLRPHDESGVEHHPTRVAISTTASRISKDTAPPSWLIAGDREYVGTMCKEMPAPLEFHGRTSPLSSTCQA